MKKTQRKKILFIALAVDIIILLSLVLVYLKDNKAILSKFECNGIIQPGNCSNGVEIKSDETALPVVEETYQPDGIIQLAVNPDLDTSYLVNPGIGWQHDINKSSEYLPETVAYSNRKEIGWNVLNPADGLYDWSALDEQLSLAVSANKLYSFRVYTMAGESFGGHKVPAWVLDKGARILPSGEPDYSNCIYQEEWGRFVQALIDRYDGNPDIAFIDISGYGNFNEWSWRDEQTQWDDLWEENYKNGTASAFTIQTIDGQARRRLVDMFIGGVFEGHECRDRNGETQTIDYSYPGVTSTQLIMPYAGIVQSTQYAFSRRADVGFRYDSLGRSSTLDIDKVGDEVSQIWKRAPVIFELSKPEEFNYEAAAQMLQDTHASLVHNNDYMQNREDLRKLIINVGYRYFLKQAQFEIQSYPGGNIDLVMIWQNVGLAPSYPKMGQHFQLHLYVVDKMDRIVADYVIPIDISTWFPSDSVQMPAPEYETKQTFILPDTIFPDTYSLLVSILDAKSGAPIKLAFSGDDGSGKYWLGNVTISGK